MFQYSVDYYFALTQTAINLQQNVNLPNNVVPQIQGTSLVGEIYRYQLVGPPHFGLTNLRTVQDWIVQRRLFTVPGVVQVNTWGGTTKEYEVDVDLHKLDAYNVTLPQVITAHRQRQHQCRRPHHQFRPAIGEHPRHRPDDSGGDEDLTQGYQRQRHRERRAVPVKRRAGVRQGRRQSLGRLRAAARQGRPRPRRRRGRGDRRHEPHAAHQRRRAARRAEIAKDQQRRQPAARRQARAVLRSHAHWSASPPARCCTT